MVDESRWFWSGESGRDSILREEIEGLQRGAYAAQRHSAQLSSQLATLQGSIETRLSALSAAFDAYVELGDVREQLAGFPDTSAVRRDAVHTIDVLSQGGRPEPVADRGQDYWLSYAVNAVRALVGGAPDPEAEGRARELSPDAELFMVAAAGALGHGPAVADRVPALLICDGTLTWRQVQVWQAALAEVYGPVVDAVRPVWSGAVDQTTDTWVGWVQARAGNSADGALHWLDGQTAFLSGDGPPTTVAVTAGPPVAAEALRLAGDAAPKNQAPAPTASPDPRGGLRTVVVDLVGRGMGNEAELLARSRVLRARIESPTADDAEVAAEPPGLTVTAAVQQALVDPRAVTSRRELLGWVAPGLRSATDQFARRVRNLPDVPVTVTSAAGSLEVYPDGADPAAVARREQTLAELNAAPLSRVAVPAVITAVFVVLVLVTLATGHPGGAAALGLGAALAAAALAYSLYDRRQSARGLLALVAGLRTEIAEGQQQAQADRRTREQMADTAGRRAAAIHARLPVPTTADAAPTSVETASERSTRAGV